MQKQATQQIIYHKLLYFLTKRQREQVYVLHDENSKKETQIIV